MKIDVTAHLGMVRQVVAKYRYDRRSFEFADLVQYGVIGLLRAARSFDPGRGVPFLPFARHFVQGEVIKALRSYNLTIRLPDHVLQAGAGVMKRHSSEYMDTCEAPDDFVARLEVEEEIAKVRACVGKLRERERRVIRGRYGIGREPSTIRGLVAEMGKCMQTIYEAEARAKCHLASLLGDRE